MPGCPAVTGAVHTCVRPLGASPLKKHTVWRRGCRCAHFCALGVDFLFTAQPSGHPTLAWLPGSGQPPGPLTLRVYTTVHVWREFSGLAAAPGTWRDAAATRCPRCAPNFADCAEGLPSCAAVFGDMNMLTPCVRNVFCGKHVFQSCGWCCGHLLGLPPAGAQPCAAGARLWSVCRPLF